MPRPAPNYDYIYFGDKDMTFVSIERNMRGFNYQRAWGSVAGFWKAMVYQRDNENNEVEWARCFDEQGTEVAEYRRGCEIPTDC